MSETENDGHRAEAELQRTAWPFLSRPSLRELRQNILTKGPDWYERPGDRAVILTLSGQKKIQAAINAKKTAGEPASVPEAGKEADAAARPATAADSGKKTGGEELQIADSKLQTPEPVAEGMPGWIGEVMVDRWKFTNPKIIQCELSDGRMILVRVHDSANYRRTLGHGTERMKVRVRMDRPGFATIIGRSPRAPGKW